MSTQAQACRRYELCPTLVRTWKQQYTRGELVDPEQVCFSQQQRIAELERMVGQLTMENALLKKAVACTLQRRRESSLPVTGPGLDRLPGGSN